MSGSGHLAARRPGIAQDEFRLEYVHPDLYELYACSVGIQCCVLRRLQVARGNDYKTFFLAKLSTMRMKRNLFAALALLLLLFRYPAAGQEPAAVLGKELNTYRQRHLQEKLYVHTDKDLYLA